MSELRAPGRGARRDAAAAHRAARDLRAAAPRRRRGLVRLQAAVRRPALAERLPRDRAPQFHTVLLSDVPQMPPRLASEARRFTWLVDVLYDRQRQADHLGGGAAGVAVHRGPAGARVPAHRVAPGRDAVGRVPCARAARGRHTTHMRALLLFGLLFGLLSGLTFGAGAQDADDAHRASAPAGHPRRGRGTLPGARARMRAALLRHRLPRTCAQASGARRWHRSMPALPRSTRRGARGGRRNDSSESRPARPNGPGARARRRRHRRHRASRSRRPRRAASCRARLRRSRPRRARPSAPRRSRVRASATNASRKRRRRTRRGRAPQRRRQAAGRAAAACLEAAERLA